MASKIQTGIIGIGKFGMALGKSLIKLGQDVIGVDNRESAVKGAQDIFSQVYVADPTDMIALKQLRLADLEYVVVCVGQRMDSSILISLHLKELGAKNIWVKAISTDHEKILHKIGVDYVIFPERFAAQQLAHKLIKPGLLQLLPFWKGVVLQELEVDQWNGQRLREIDMTNRFGAQVVAIKKAGQDEFRFVPRADLILEKGDMLVVIGDEETIAEIIP